MKQPSFSWKIEDFTPVINAHVQTVFIYRLGHSDVFNLIHQHNLFSSIQDKIIMLMEFDKEVHI